MSREQEQHLPSCPLTVHCVRLIDELDSREAEREELSLARISAIRRPKDDKDAVLVARLRAHVPGCPTCQAAIEQARQQRSQIRAALHDVLREGEQVVPSTAASILFAIRVEQSQQRAESPIAGMIADSAGTRELEGHSPVRPLNGRGHQQSARRPSRRRIVWQNIAAIAAVLILLLSAFGLLDHRIFGPSPGGMGSSTPTMPQKPTHVVNSPTTSTVTPTIPGTAATSSNLPAPFGGWNSVAVFTSSMTLGNLNYLTDCCTMLATEKLPAGTIFDGVSPDGRNVMYHIYSNGVTAYYTLTSARTNAAVYRFNGKSGNAVWMDSSHVLITTYSSVVEVDVQAMRSSTVLASLLTPRLTFYRKPYLYFTGGADRSLDALYRINMDDGTVQQVTFPSTGTTFWLSPDGFTVYFANEHGPAEAPGIYAVNSDGSNMHLLRQYPYGTPIGYGTGNALLIMRVVKGAFQVVQLGATAQQDVVLLPDAAPGASALCNTTSVGADSICDANIALAPYGHALVIQGYYTGGTYKVWSDDLTTGQQRVIPSLSGTRSAAQLIGWDTMPAQ